MEHCLPGNGRFWGQREVKVAVQEHNCRGGGILCRPLEWPHSLFYWLVNVANTTIVSTGTVCHVVHCLWLQILGQL